MSFFDAIMLIGGIALFLFGMNVMSTGLEKTAGSRLEITLRKATSNMPKALLLGVAITGAIQSSSAVTIMLVGLVNSGVMKFQQTIGVIMGTNIGTTVTAWILSLTGISGDNVFINLLKPDYFSQIFAAVGITLIMFSKRAKRRSFGEVLIGFAVLMAGMAVMRSAVSGLEGNEEFTRILTAFSNPLLGVLFGALVTAILQSSSASVAILQAVVLTAGISYGTVIPIIMGQNIGTCLTAIISSLGANKNAKRVAVVHVYFNTIGTVVLLAVLYAARATVGLPFWDDNVGAVSVAIIHSVFNISTTAIMFPFAGQLEKLAKMTIRGVPGEETKYEFLDERLLAAPALAISQCHLMVVEMGNIARETILQALSIIEKYDEKTAAVIRENENVLDQYEDRLNTFLVKLSSQRISNGDSWKVAELLHIIGDLERIGDHALNILESAEEMKDKDIVFSDEAGQDLAVMHTALSEIINMTIGALENDDMELASRVEPLEEAIDDIISLIRSRHIGRLQRGECTIVPGFVWNDMMVNYERVSDHCSNMAICILQTESKTMTRHTYLNTARSPENAAFVAQYNEYKEKYRITDFAD